MKKYFLPAHNIKEVHCVNEQIFVTSSTYPQNIYVDWLNYSGDLLGQFKVRLKEADTVDYRVVQKIDLQDNLLSLNVAYFKIWPRQQQTMESYLYYVVTIDTYLSERVHGNSNKLLN